MFDYRGFTEQDFNKTKADVLNKIIEEDYVGCVRIGDLCFDIVAYPEVQCFCIDLYIGGIDDGYGYKNGYPYTQYDGFDVPFHKMETSNYEEFKGLIERRMFLVITKADKTYHTLDKANQELHVW